MKSTLLATILAVTVAVPARAESTADPYPAAYAATLRDRLPLLVFVGKPAAEWTGARTISVKNFPDTSAPGVVVCVARNDGMFRKDLPATASTSDIQAAIASLATVTEGDALDEVNATRAARGLRPFIRDDYLTMGAKNAAQMRAASLTEGHTSNDFAALPPGGNATAAGCAAWEPSMGWGACCTYENYTYAGAAYVFGRDGRRYMHLFVR
jgi:hypothetical protein